MAVCPTPRCGEKLPIHGRRLYCTNCRSTMARWAKRSVREVVAHSDRLVRGIFRVEHKEERKVDQLEAVSQLRRLKRERDAKQSGRRKGNGYKEMGARY